MNEFVTFGVAGSAYAAGALDASDAVNPGIAGLTVRRIAPAAHAAWAVEAIAPQRKRRTAVATDTSVDRGFI
ncbi:MAG: hypothetical protein WBB07_12940 [Mycobacterium sp.]